MKYIIPVTVLSILSLMAWAQQPAPADPSDAGEIPTISVDVDVVNIFCTVRDKHGGLVSDLEKEDFILEEDGVEEEIRYFTRETDLPLTIGLLVDVSKSQESLIEVEKAAGYRFFSDILRQEDLAFIISFGVYSELLQDLTNSRDLLREGLNALRLNAAVGGITPGTIPTRDQPGTVLYDAVFLASDEMLRKEVGRKVMVVITDGVDYGSKVEKSEAIRVAHKADTIIYGIYYADPRYQAFRNGYGDLKDLSEETGGTVFRVSRKYPLHSIFAAIEEEMRNQYSLGYTPTNDEKDGSFRKIKIKTRQDGLEIRAREGYYASRGS